MASILRRVQHYDSSPWDSESNVIWPAGYATSDAALDALVFRLFNFDSPLPAEILALDGIEVIITAEKDETNGSGNLGVQIELSWDGGSTWTSAKSQSNLTTTPADYTLGSDSDDWGHTWTRAELADNDDLQLRLKSIGSSIIDDPQWRVWHITVTLHYGVTHALSGNEFLTLTDSQDMSRKVLSLTDSISLSDTAATEQGGASGKGQQQVEFGGPPILAQQASPNFTTAAANNVHRESYGMLIFMPGAAPFLAYIGDDSTMRSTNTTASETHKYQSGMADVGDSSRSGSYAGGSERRTQRCSVHNSQLVSLIGADRSLPAAMKAAQVQNAFVKFYAFVEDDSGAWHQYPMIEGEIDWFNVGDEFTDMIIVESHAGHTLAPNQKVTESSFEYGKDEGEFPEDWAGRVIPVGYGHFNFLAHGVSVQTIFSDPLEGPGIPGLLGYAVPSFPVVLASIDYQARKDSTHPRLTRNLMFLQGDTRPPAIDVRTRGNGFNFLFPLSATHSDPTNLFLYSSLHTWDASVDRAILLGTDYSNDQAAVAEGSQAYAGVGDWREKQAVFTNGTAQNSVPMFANHATPNFPVGTKRWSGTLGFVAIPFAGNGYFNAEDPFRNQGVWFNDKYSSNYTLLDSLRRILSRDFGSYSQAVMVWDANQDAFAYFQCLVSAVDRGEIVSARMCFATDGGTGRPDASVEARYAGGTGFASPGDEIRVYEQTNTTQDSQTNCDFIITSTSTYFSVLIKKAQEDFIQSAVNPAWVQGSPEQKAAMRGFLSPWDFKHKSGTNLRGGLIQDFATEIGIQVKRPVSGQEQIVFYDAWFEIVYKHSFYDSANFSVPDGATRQPASKTTGRFHQNTLLRAGNLAAAHFSGGKLRPFTLRQGNGAIPPPVLNLPYSGNIKDFRTRAVGLGNYFTYGTGAIDDAAGKYTGTPSAIVNQPTDMIGHLLAHYTGEFALRSLGSDFGSFATAKTQLGSAAQLVTPIYEQEELQTHFDRITADCMAFVRRHDGIWRIFVDTDDPASDCPARIYGTTFGPETVVPGTFKVYASERTDVKLGFQANYKYNLASGKYHGSMYVNAEETNFASNGAAYQQICSDASLNYKATETLEMDFPDIWSAAWMEVVLKWWADKRTRDFRIIEFDAYLSAIDLREGHILNISDEMETPIHEGVPGVTYPGSIGGTDWSDHTFDVIDATLQTYDNAPARIHVTAVETYSKAV